MTKKTVRGLILGLVACGAFCVLPAAAMAGSIAGTVKSAAGGEGIGGVWVCTSNHVFYPHGGCDTTDGEGKYRIESLEPSFYRVVFAEESSMNYLTQWYPGVPEKAEAGWVEVQSGQDVTGIDAVLQTGGQITGRVTDAVTHSPVEGIHVCAPQLNRVSEEGVIRCDRSGSDGEYLIQSLPTGLYQVEFFVEGEPNYMPQYYPGKANAAEAQPVSVTAGAPPITDIDAALQEGVQIKGRVTETGNGGPIPWIRVCALAGEKIEDCEPSEPDGTYSIPGLRPGSYAVAFAVDEREGGVVWLEDGYVRQYYDRTTSLAEASLLGASGPRVFTGIDAVLTKGPEIWPPEREPILVSFVPTPKQPLKCGKGFRRKVGRAGGERCVRKVNCRRWQRKVKRKGQVRCAPKRKPQRGRLGAR